MENIGKHFENFRMFLNSVRKGERSIMVGPDYIVLSKEAYDGMMKKFYKPHEYVSYDEMVIMEWNKLEDWVKTEFMGTNIKEK